MTRSVQLSGLVAAALLFAACAPPAPSAAPASTNPPAATSAGAAAPQPTAAPKPAAPVAAATSSGAAPAAQPAAQPASTQPGQPEETPIAPIAEVKIGLPGDLVSPTPFFAFSIIDKSFLKHVAPALTRISETGELLPALALSWQNIQPDTWQFKLRPNVKFHNGEPFTAAAIKTNLDVLFDPATKATQTTNFKIIKDVQILDDLTVNLVTAQPSPILPRTISDFHILAPNDLKEKGFEAAGAHLIGTGPYKFVEWVKGDHATLEANPDYWGGKPAIQKLTFRPITEDGARIAALLAGDIDLAYNVPTELAKQIDSSGKAKTVSVMTSTIYLLGMNQIDSSLPTAKKEVRQAISYAIDRQGLIDAIMGGIGAPVATLFHATSFGRDASLKPYPYDPNKSKQLLAQAGYPNGFSIHMVAPQNGRWPKSQELAEAMVSELGQVGIKVDLQLLEYTAFTQAVFSHKQPMALWGWGDVAADPNSVLLQLNTCPERNGPWVMACIPDLDKAAWEQQSEINPDKRAALLKQAQQIMYDEQIHAPLFQIGQMRGVSPKIWDWYRIRPDEGFWLFHPVKG